MLPMGFGDDMLRFNGIGENVTWGMYNNDKPTEAQKEQYYEVAKWAAITRHDADTALEQRHLGSIISSMCSNG